MLLQVALLARAARCRPECGQVWVSCRLLLLLPLPRLSLHWRLLPRLELPVLLQPSLLSRHLRLLPLVRRPLCPLPLLVQARKSPCRRRRLRRTCRWMSLGLVRRASWCWMRWTAAQLVRPGQ